MRQFSNKPNSEPEGGIFKTDENEELVEG